MSTDGKKEVNFNKSAGSVTPPNRRESQKKQQTPKKQARKKGIRLTVKGEGDSLVMAVDGDRFRFEIEEGKTQTYYRESIDFSRNGNIISIAPRGYSVGSGALGEGIYFLNKGEGKYFLVNIDLKNRRNKKVALWCHADKKSAPVSEAKPSPKTEASTAQVVPVTAVSKEDDVASSSEVIADLTSKLEKQEAVNSLLSEEIEEVKAQVIDLKNEVKERDRKLNNLDKLAKETIEEANKKDVRIKELSTQLSELTGSSVRSESRRKKFSDRYSDTKKTFSTPDRKPAVTPKKANERSMKGRSKRMKDQLMDKAW